MSKLTAIWLFIYDLKSRFLVAKNLIIYNFFALYFLTKLSGVTSKFLATGPKKFIKTLLL